MTGRSVCILTSQYPPQTGGLGHSTFRIANMLAEHGLTTHVLAFRKSLRPLPLDEAITTSVEGAITVHRALVWYADWREDPAELESPINEATALTRYNREMFELLNHLQTRHQFDVLHAFFLYPAGFIATTVARYHDVKSIVSIRGNDVGKYAFDPLRRQFLQSALRQADYVTSVATSLLALADRTIHPLDENARVILNSLNLDLVRPKSHPQLPLRGPVVGTMGLFRYKKGLIYLFKALARLHEDGQEFTLLLAGDFFNPEDKESHLAYLEDLDLLDRTVVTGRLPHEAVFDYLQLFDVLVFPSLFSEGCPLSMLEAMAMKRAIIASRTGAIPEVLQDEHSGLLVGPGSSADIYHALVRLIEDGDLRSRLGQNAFDQVQQMSPENELNEWLAVYDAVLPEEAAPATEARY